MKLGEDTIGEMQEMFKVTVTLNNWIDINSHYLSLGAQIQDIDIIRYVDITQSTRIHCHCCELCE